MLSLSGFAFLLHLVVGGKGIQLSTYNTTVYFSGGLPDCQSDGCLSGTFFQDYQYFDTGDPFQRNFFDPLPDGFLIKMIYIYFMGAFHCALVSPNSATVAIFINEQVHQEQYQLPAQDLCCKNCQAEAAIPPDSIPGNFSWFSGYNYHGYNYIKVLVLSNALSLSSITIEIYALDAVPEVVNMIPASLPSTGGTIRIQTTAIYGQIFRYICSISSGVQIVAVIDAKDPNVVTCNLPPVAAGIYELSLYPETSSWTDQEFSNKTNFTFYDQPRIGYISPVEGDASGGITVSVFGDGFFMSANLSCMFGEVVVPATWQNEGSITCVSPNGTAGKKVPFSVSENGYSFLDTSFSFTYQSAPPLPLTPLIFPKKGINMWVIIGCSIFIGLIAICGIGCIIYKRKYSSSNSYDSIPADLEPTVIIPYSELDLRERIGKGSFGEVYRAYWRYTEVAVKKIGEPTETLICELFEEVKLMTKLRHPNVVNFMACTTEPDVCLVQEYVVRGSLYKVLHNRDIILELDHVRRFAVDTCKGMAYLHGSKIIHRDLKSHNLLVDKDWNIKVCDFGLSRTLEETHRSTTLTACGTPCWTAPEILRGKRYTVKADVYSFGVCLWEMVTREDPYAGTPPYQVVINVATKGTRPTLSKAILPGFSTIISQCWAESPDTRPRFGDLIVQLEDMEFQKSPRFPIVLGVNIDSNNNASSTHGSNDNSPRKSPVRQSGKRSPAKSPTKSPKVPAKSLPKSPGKFPKFTKPKVSKSPAKSPVKSPAKSSLLKPSQEKPNYYSESLLSIQEPSEVSISEAV